jgi:hypothetical protein
MKSKIEIMAFVKTIGLVAPVVACGLLIDSGTRALAASLLPAQWSGTTQVRYPGAAGVPQTLVTGPGTTTEASGSGGSESATIIGSSNPNPSITATALAASPNSNTSALAEAQLLYYVEILGPAGQVSLDVQASGTTSTSLGSNQQATVGLQATGALAFSFTAFSESGLPYGGNPTSFNVNNTYQVQANSPIAVLLSASAAAGLTTSGSASATIDPLFFIDPNFVNAGQYSIEISSGIGNSPNATPLPSTWLMLLGGLAGLGFIAHRGSKNDSTAFASA